MIFETHAHYDDKRFNKDRDNILNELNNAGISHVVNVGANIQTSKQSIALAEKYSYVYAAIGVHPHDAKELDNNKMQWLKNAAAHPKVVAIGEIGLDYYYDHSDRATQRQWFESQLELAKEVNLPVIIHSRDAAKETIEIMENKNAKDIGGVVHCFSYTKETAEIFLKMGFYIGIGGVVTFKNAKKLIEAVKIIPLDRILLETDAPYLTPDPHRGERNDSTYIPHVARKIAEIKEISYEQVVEQTHANAKKMYKII